MLVYDINDINFKFITFSKGAVKNCILCVILVTWDSIRFYAVLAELQEGGVKHNIWYEKKWFFVFALNSIKGWFC